MESGADLCSPALRGPTRRGAPALGFGHRDPCTGYSDAFTRDFESEVTRGLNWRFLCEARKAGTDKVVTHAYQLIYSKVSGRLAGWLLKGRVESETEAKTILACGSKLKGREREPQSFAQHPGGLALALLTPN